MGKPLVFNIQKYSIHDGRGIRTTVFFKGCPLSCKWCHNPESQRFEKELLFHADRCTGCGACSLVCQTGAISMKGAESVDFAELLSASAVSGQDNSGVGFCPTSDSSDADIAMPDSRAEAAASGFGRCFPGDRGELTVDRQIPWKADFVNQNMRQGRQEAFVDMTGASQQEKSVLSRMDRTLCRMCGACVAACPHNAREEAGKEYELPDLIRELEKDRMFYEQSGGGITLSGGEPLAQDMDYIEALVRRLHEKGYSVNVDTCGYVPYEHIRRVLPFTDTFLYDIKLLDAKAHRDYTGVDNGLILENLKTLSTDGGKINIRLPLIDRVNATEEYLCDIIRFLQDNAINPYRINLLKYHDTGSGKYARLDRLYDRASMAAPDSEWLEQAASRFRQSGFHNIQIGG